MTLRWQRTGAVAAFAACAVVTVLIARRDIDLALAGGSGWVLTAELAAGAMVAVAAIVTWRPGATFPVLLLGAAIAWLVAEWNSPAAGTAFTAGLVLYASWPPLLAAAALRGLDERRIAAAGAATIAAGLVATVGLLGVASALVFDPSAQSCGDCPSNWLAVTNAPQAGRTIGQVGLAAIAAWAAIFGVVAGVRLTRSSPTRRRLVAPVLLPAVIAVALFAVDAIHGFDRGFLSNDQTDRTLRLAEAMALALVAAGVANTRLRTRRTRRKLAELVVDIGAAATADDLRARLAKSLGDSSLELLYRLDGARWVDADGRPASIPASGQREATHVRSRGEDVLIIVHRPGLLDDPDLLQELATTAGLALQHERLNASLRAQLEELRASCARIVAASDAARRALERDLHDGAQQRLVALALDIRLARRQIAGDDPTLDAALAADEADIRAAVVDLREVAHGLFPEVLASEGLAPALEELAEQTPRLFPRGVPDRRFPGEVESAGYFAALEALRLTDHEVTVDGVAENGRLHLVIRTDGRLETAMTEIRDRVAALGGTVAAQNGELRLEMPCES